MRKTRMDSVYETLFSLVVGMAINFVLNATVFPLMGWPVSTAQNFTIIGIYTGVSVIRGYFVSRYFEYRLRKRWDK